MNLQHEIKFELNFFLFINLPLAIIYNKMLKKIDFN